MHFYYLTVPMIFEHFCFWTDWNSAPKFVPWIANQSYVLFFFCTTSFGCPIWKVDVHEFIIFLNYPFLYWVRKYLLQLQVLEKLQFYEGIFGNLYFLNLKMDAWDILWKTLLSKVDKQFGQKMWFLHLYSSSVLQSRVHHHNFHGILRELSQWSCFERFASNWLVLSLSLCLCLCGVSLESELHPLTFMPVDLLLNI